MIGASIELPDEEARVEDQIDAFDEPRSNETSLVVAAGSGDGEGKGTRSGLCAEGVANLEPEIRKLIRAAA